MNQFSSQILIKMTHKEFKAKLEAIPDLELAEKAQSALRKLCSTGGQSFTMTVPPRLDDTDMILSEVIKRFKLLHLETVQNSIYRGGSNLGETLQDYLNAKP